ncbi:CynX/NimT family MFS transporter [Alicyclobacillus fodiniaquatilis]|uniref:CynX/NimT family MFS transporter n=1 Tax=Alicyclobacillus fodiniaquatilis TaxID=1661150 RepID=A0ABW4JFB7_9BACL
MKKQTTISDTNRPNVGWLLLLGIIFVAFNLRPAITSVGPLINSIRIHLDISNGIAGLVTTLPLIAFAVLSPLAPRIGHRLGNECTILLGIIVLMIGVFVRSIGDAATLFIGTALIGLGVAICNVLLPSLVKHKFPTKVGLMTGIYSTSMGIFAALASGVSVPLASGLHLGWQKSLVVWAAIAIIAAIVWLPQLRFHDKANLITHVNHGQKSILRSPLAWKVTFFMGLQSFLFYSTIAWLPDILTHDGMSASAAGWMLCLMQVVSLPATFITPLLAGRLPNQKSIVLGLGILYLIGITGLLVSGSIALAVVWTILIGIGQGSSISLALTLLGLRTTSAKQAADLSGMAQSIGYLLAAVGPVLVGFVFDATNSWTVPLIILLVCVVLTILAGLGAGRNAYVDGSTPAEKSRAS